MLQEIMENYIWKTYNTLQLNIFKFHVSDVKIPKFSKLFSPYNSKWVYSAFFLSA